MAGTLTAEPIFLRVGPLQVPLERFVAASSLAFCTTATRDGNGTTHVVPKWHPNGFSRGEQVLWRILRDLAAGDLHDAFDRLDVRNLRALAAVFAYMESAVA